MIYKICLHQEFFCFFFKEMLHFWGSVIKMDMHTLLYLKWIINKALLYSTWNSVQCYVAAWMGGESGGEWIRMAKSLRCLLESIRTLLISSCCCLLTKLCLSCVWLFCEPMDCSPPGSSLHGISQARILEWVAISFSQGVFPTPGLNPSLLHWQADSFPLSHQGSPLIEYTPRQSK